MEQIVVFPKPLAPKMNVLFANPVLPPRAELRKRPTFLMSMIFLSIFPLQRWGLNQHSPDARSYTSILRQSEDASVRLIEHVVIQGSAGVDRAHQHEADRGSLLIERVVILGSAAVDRRHQHEADRARRHPAGRRPVWIEGTGMRVTAPVWIEAPA